MKQAGLFLVFLVFSTALFGQRGVDKENRERKLGLVLSGGGAKGFAHIGVLRVLEEENLDVKIITGTSMGAIIGGLYSIGYSVDSLEYIATTSDWVKILGDQVSRKRESMEKKMQEGRYVLSLPIDSGRVRLPESLVTGQLVSEMLSRLTVGYHQEMNFRDLPISFAAIAADIETGEPVLFDRGILPEAIRASISIPTIFKPVELNGKTWVDGGITRNLPAVEALEMGADVLIGIDVAPQLKKADQLTNLLEIMEQTVSYSMSTSSMLQKEYCDLVIQPEMDEFHMGNYDRAKEIIALGEAAARRALPEIRRLADSLDLRIKKPDVKPTRVLVNEQKFRISSLLVQNLERISMTAIRSDLNLSFPKKYTLRDIEQAVARVYGSGYFAFVRYRIVPDALEKDSYQLVLDIKETQESAIQVGFRFDTYNKASLLFNAVRQNVLKEGGVASMDLRVGNDVMFDGQLFLHTSYQPRLGIRFNVNAIRSNLDVYDERPKRIDNIRITALYADFLTGIMYQNWLVSGIGVRAEVYDYSASILSNALLIDDTPKQRFLNFYGLISIDRLDRSAFPENGYSFQSRLSISRKELGSPLNFSYHYADFKGFQPITSDFSVFSRVFAGITTDSDIPFHYQFYLGGANHPTVFGPRHVSFIGLPAIENAGRNVRLIQTGMQYEVSRNRYIQVIYNSGSLFPDWRNPIGGKELKGGGVVIGGLTPFGPIDFTLGASSANTLVFEINAGFRF